MTNKKALRESFLSKRKGLSTGELNEKSLLIVEQFKAYYAQQPVKNVHLFLPIKKQAEINTWPIVAFLREESTGIIVSRSDFENLTLTHYFLEESTPVEANKWGIPEPQGGREASIDIIEMVLVPLVIFDLRGSRVGYGKGFYDKFLHQCPKHTIKVGLSLFPAVDEIQADEHDVQLDLCITPGKIYRFDQN